jgi:hypothetical protein
MAARMKGVTHCQILEQPATGSASKQGKSRCTLGSALKKRLTNIANCDAFRVELGTGMSNLDTG